MRALTPSCCRCFLASASNAGLSLLSTSVGTSYQVRSLQALGPGALRTEGRFDLWALYQVITLRALLVTHSVKGRAGVTAGLPGSGENVLTVR
jgi:hypothetical protein